MLCVLSPDCLLYCLNVSDEHHAWTTNKTLLLRHWFGPCHRRCPWAFLDVFSVCHTLIANAIFFASVQWNKYNFWLMFTGVSDDFPTLVVQTASVARLRPNLSRDPQIGLLGDTTDHKMKIPRSMNYRALSSTSHMTTRLLQKKATWSATLLGYSSDHGVIV